MASLLHQYYQYILNFTICNIKMEYNSKKYNNILTPAGIALSFKNKSHPKVTFVN